MAASLTKTFSFPLRRVVGTLCCSRTPRSTRLNIFQNSGCLHRCLSVRSCLQKENIVRQESEPGNAYPVPEDMEELDVLYKKLVVEIKGHDRQVLRSYDKFVRQTAQHLDITISAFSKPKMDVNKHSVLKSVHIYKKHFSQYEERTHFSVFELAKLTGCTADTFLEYIQRNLPEGMAMKVTRQRLEKLPEHLKPPSEKIPATTKS